MTSKATIVICCTSHGQFFLITMEAKLDELLKSVKSLAEEQKQNKTEIKSRLDQLEKDVSTKQRTEYAAGGEEAETSSGVRIQTQRQ